MLKAQYSAAVLMLALRNAHADAQQAFNFHISRSVNPLFLKGRFAVVKNPLR